MSTEKQELITYLDRFWAEDAKAYISVKVDDETYKVIPIPSWGAKKEQVADRIIALVASGAHVYFAPSNYQPDAESKEKVYVRGSRFLWTDMDGNALEVLANWPGDIPEPTMRNQTGPDGHEHWYWELDREHTLDAD